MQTGDVRVDVHHLVVGHDVCATDLEHVPVHVGLAEHSYEVREHVAYRNRLYPRLDPARGRHDGKDLDQMPQHLETRASRTDDDSGA